MLMNFFLRLSKNLPIKALVLYLSKYGLLTYPPPIYQNQIARLYPDSNECMAW